MVSTQVSLLSSGNLIYEPISLINFSIGVTTKDLDGLAAETCAYMSVVHPDYSKLAARIAISHLHKETTEDFLEVCKPLKFYKDA